MTRLLFSSWLNRMTHPQSRKRRCSGSPSRRRNWLVLESLEGRWVPSTVTNLNDSGTGSLRQAILDTPVGGTVDFQTGLSGTITLTTGELDIAKGLTIAGPGADVITVSGNHAFRVVNNFGISVAISGLTVANGQISGSGGGINNTGTLTIDDCTISGNAATAGTLDGGGGIFNAGILTVNRSNISGNSALGSYVGGGGGGGIYNRLTANIIDSIITGNSAPFYTTPDGGGGGIRNEGTLTILESTLTDNYANSGGGAILDVGKSGSSLTVTASTISANIANTGGGIDSRGESQVTLTNCTLSGNIAGTGGGIYVNTGLGAINDSTISDNSALDFAGGIFDNGSVFNRNNIIAQNTGPSFPDVEGFLSSQGHNLIGDGSGGDGYDPTDLVGTAANPIDSKLGPLHDNGGPTQTMAPLPSSPAIDAGDPTDAPPTDQRGLPRVLDSKIDIGAVELRVFHVTSTADSGPQSLRQAILDANDTPGTNGIAFALGAGGVQTIAPTSPLPAVTNAVEIDGATQPGYTGTPLIELAGEGAGPGADGLTLTSAGSTVTGLVVGGFGGAGVSISGNGNRVVGNFIGTDATGTMGHPNGTGVAVVYIGSNNTIGGTALGAGNLISGNLQDGVGIYGGSGNTIQGNFIGTDAAGLTALPNGYGVELYSGSYNSVGGGNAAGAGNLISGNLYDGIGIYSDGNTVQGNRIGTDVSGTAPLGNGGDGVAIEAFLHGYDNAIGGTDPGTGNTIAYNGGYGVRITTGTGEAIRQNAIYANGAGGIVLLNGGNQDEPAPQLTSAVAGVGTVTVVGTVAGTPGAELVLEFFANTMCDPSGYGQGERFLGSTTVVVGPDGEADFTAIVEGTVDVGQFITGTATDPAGNTSQFSNCVEVTGMDIVGGGPNREAVLSGSVMPIRSARNSDSAPTATQAQALPGDLWASQAAPIEATVPPVPMTMVPRAQDAVFEAWDTARDRLADNWM
jgi:hypothetical protein